MEKLTRTRCQDSYLPMSQDKLLAPMLAALRSDPADPRTLAQWTDYLGGLECEITAQDEALVDSLVRPGHPSTPGYSDPQYPIEARR